MKGFLEALQNLGDGGEELRTYTLDRRARITVGDQTAEGRVVRMSPGFAAFVGTLSAAPGTQLELKIDGIDRVLRARFVEAANGVAHGLRELRPSRLLTSRRLEPVDHHLELGDPLLEPPQPH